ncbi:MAG TPA: hypothetical protein VKT72_17220 [Candidatus Baltobacteraceae bacterium]|nr:hypothetical protein [Candidatus Baltobacteraceae bacterium]
METTPEGPLAETAWFAILVWGLPVAALFLSGFLTLSTPLRAAIWTAANATMGVGCVVSVMRCGRLHCYFTAPFFLILALAGLLLGLGVLPAGKHTWNILGAIFTVGAIVLYFVPEAVFGRYARRSDS